MTYDEEANRKFICQQCNCWENVRYDVLQPITQNIKNIDDKVKKQEYNLNMLPRYMKCLKTIDFIKLGNVWTAIYVQMKKKKWEAPIFASHFSVADVIPLNLSFYTKDLEKCIEDKLSDNNKSIKLDKYTIKDIVNENLELIEENIKHNENINKEITEILDAKPKLTKDIMVLKNRLSCIELINKCAELYCKDSEPIPLTDFERLEQKVYNCGYRGHFYQKILQELEQYRTLKENFKYILKDYKIASDSTNCSEPNSQIPKPPRNDDQIDHWNSILIKKVTDTQFGEVLKKANESKIAITEELEQLNEIAESIRAKKSEINDTVLCGKLKLDFESVEKIVDDTLKSFVIPHEEILKLIEVYQLNKERERLIDEYLDSKTISINYEEFSKFIEEINELEENSHLLPEDKIVRIKKLHKFGTNIKAELEKIGEKELKKAKALIKEVPDHKFYFDKLKYFLDRIIVHHANSIKGAEDRIYTSLAYCNILVKELNDPNKEFEDFDQKKAAKALSNKIKLTNEKLVELKETTDLEKCAEIIEEIKHKGLYTNDIDAYYQEFKYYSEWFLETQKLIQAELQEKNMKDKNDEIDFINDHKPLLLLSSIELNTYLDKIRDTSELPFKNAQKLATNLRVCIWTQEYDKVRKEKENDVLDLTELTALKELATDYNIKPDDCDELVKLIENYEINQIIQKFKETGDEEVLESLLQYKSAFYATLLKNMKEKFDSAQVKIADKYIKYGEALTQLKVAIDALTSGSSLIKAETQDKFAKKTTKEESDDPDQQQYDKLVEHLNKVESSGVPESAFWYKYLKENLLAFEKWRKHVDRYQKLKEKHKGKVDELVINKGDYFEDDKVKQVIIAPYEDLIIKPADVIPEVEQDLETLSQWVKDAKELIEKYEESQPIDEINEEQQKEIKAIYDRMRSLPLLSKSKKSVFNAIYSYGWLTTIQKVIANAEKGTKLTYEKWVEFDKQIRNFKSTGIISTSGIYKQFKSAFEKGTKVKDVMNKKKSKASRVSLQNLETFCDEAKNLPIELDTEIKSVKDSVVGFKALQASLAKVLKTKPDINDYLQILRDLRDSPFLIDKEEKQINKIKKEYEDVRKKVKNYLISIMTKNASKDLKITKVNHLITQYQSCKCVFAEGEKLIEERDKNKNTFEGIKSNFAKNKKDKKLLWDEVMQYEADLKALRIHFEKDEDQLMEQIEKMKVPAFLQQFEQFLENNQPSKYKFKLSEAETLSGNTDGDVEMKDEESPDPSLCKKLKEYISNKSTQINEFNEYIECKESLEKSKIADIIDFEILYNIRLKDLKNVKMKELAKKRQVAKKKKDEENKQKLAPEEYKVLKKKEKIKRKNRTKTDWFLDKGVDEDWDSRYLKYAEPDIALQEEWVEEKSEKEETTPEKKRDKKAKAKKDAEKATSKAVSTKVVKKSAVAVKKTAVTKKAAAIKKSSTRIVKKESRSEETEEKSTESVKDVILKKIKDSRSKSEFLLKKLKKDKKPTDEKNKEQPSQKTTTSNKETKATDSQGTKIGAKKEEAKTKPTISKKPIKKAAVSKKPAIKKTETKKDTQKSTDAEAPKIKPGIKKNSLASSGLKTKPNMLAGKKRKLGGGGGGLAASLKKINK